MPTAQTNFSLRMAIMISPYNQKTVAQLSEISPNRLSKIAGGFVKPRSKEKERIAGVLKMEVSALFGTKQKEENDAQS